MLILEGDHVEGIAPPVLLEPFSGEPNEALALQHAVAPRQRLGTAAREYVLPRFGVDRYVTSVVALYDRLLGTRSAA